LGASLSKPTVFDKPKQQRYNVGTMTISAKTWRYLLVIGDLLALILFVLVGQTDHGTVDKSNPLLGVLQASWEFALLWLLVGWPLNAFPQFENWTTRDLLGRALLTWLVAAPLGLLLRSLVLSRLNIPTLFLAATLGFGILFLWAWRLLLILIWRIASRR
jgi:hypothetical protein